MLLLTGVVDLAAIIDILPILVYNSVKELEDDGFYPVYEGKRQHFVRLVVSHIM